METAPGPQKLPYRQEFDGLRAVCILLVVADHFGLTVPDGFQIGTLGVKLFFILSGYFITWSLWSLIRGHGAADPGKTIFIFYGKRFLRVIPPLYFSLLLGVLLGIPEVKNNLWWHLTFLTNGFIIKTGYWPDAVSHYWSLCVQEHFYLFWPLLVFFCPRRWFVPVLALLAAGALAFRVTCILTDIPTIARWVSLPGCMDAFAVGALVAWAENKGHTRGLLDPLRRRLFLFAAAAAGLWAGYLLKTLPETNPWLGLSETFEMVFLGGIALWMTSDRPSWVRSGLKWRPLAYLGKLSYGIYIYHVLVIIALNPWFESKGLADQPPVFRLAVLMATTLALAFLSRIFLEKPCLRAKDMLTAWWTRPKASAG